MTTIDNWTFVHFMAGLVAGSIGIKTKDWFIVAVLWELIEPHLAGTKWVPEYNESMSNRILDVIVGVGGAEVGKHVKGVLRG